MAKKKTTAEIEKDETRTTAVGMFLRAEGRGLIFAALSLLLSCSEEKPKSSYILEEVIDVKGTCSENHVGQSDVYSGQIVRWKTIETGEITTYGFVTQDGEITQRIIDEAKQPTAYHTPFMISFTEIRMDTNQPKLVLHGVSKRAGESRGYDSTCGVEVVKRGTELSGLGENPANRRK
jgi:hypothetical protein